MEEKAWGVRLNNHPDYQRLSKGQRPPGSPDWLEPHHIQTWQEQGLVMWNSPDKKMECLSGHEILKLLGQLKSHDDWKSGGISITRLVHKIEIPIAPRGRRKKTEQEPNAETAKAEPIYEELLHLPPEAGSELIELLLANEAVISEMADREKKRAADAMRQVWDVLFAFTRKKEQTEVDFQHRSLEWSNDETSRWNCQYQSAEGRVRLDKSKFFWHACVKRKGHVGNSDFFMELPNAVEWVEKEVVELATQPEVSARVSRVRPDKQIEADHVRLREKLMASSYWIDPDRMEPPRITHQLFVELDARPISFKTYESMCGDTWHYDERYLSPFKLAETLKLGIHHFKIDQPIGENSEWYRITSLTAYYQESSAAEQAQRIWDQSKILQQFKEGKIDRARYGYQEVETGFVEFLGGCESPDNPRGQLPTRNEYMNLQALRESLCFSLDVTGYRDYLGVSPEFISDEQTLKIMHSTRARSKYLSEEIKRESRIWLAQNDSLTQ